MNSAISCIQEYATATRNKIQSHLARSIIILCLGIIASVLMFLFCGGTTFGVKRIFIIFLIGIGSSLLCILPEIPRVISYLLTILYLAYVPAKIFDRFELPMHDMSQTLDGVKFLSVLLIFCVYLLCFLLSQRINYALGIGNILILFVFLVEYFLCSFRGTVFMPSDFQAIGTALSVAHNYQFILSPEAIYSIGYFMFFTILGFKLSAKPNKYIRIGGSIAAVGMVLFTYYIIMVSPYLQKHEITGVYWNMSANHRLDGCVLSYFVILRESNMSIPDGYSAERLDEISKWANRWYEEKDCAKQKPNIIMIMNEAWSDLDVLGDIETSEPVMPFVESLQENTASGNLYVSILGGLTANTEFESITGNTLTFLQPGCVPYPSLITQKMPSFGGVLSELGYQTMAMHPSIASAWNRDKVYPYLGFDEFIDVDKFQTEYLYERDFISDECTYNEIIARYENRVKNKPFFMFDITIQNHGGYYGNIPLPIEVNYINETDVPNWLGYTYDLQTYLNMMNITDRAFEKLVTYFEKVEEPTIICMYGDHQPVLHDDFYSAIFSGSTLSEQERNLKKYITPYIIWANYDVNFKDYGDFSANYLPAVLMECSGQKLPDFYKFLMLLKEEYPVLSLAGCLDKYGNYSELVPEGELIDRYRNLQYGQLFDKKRKWDVFLTCEDSEEWKWYKEFSTVSHALGATLEGDTLTNSKEAFLYNYERGQRLFEVDIQCTSDNEMVLRHDWASDLGQAEAFGWTEENKEVPSKDKFLATPILGKYTPMTLAELFSYMNKYKDVYIITDTKYTPEVIENIQLLVDTAINNGYEEELSRVIIQLYYEDMYDEIMSVYPFENVLYTLYYVGYPGAEETISFCKGKNIPVLVMPYDWWSESMQSELGESVKVYLHTVNDDEDAKRAIRAGVQGIYTDSIFSEQLRE